MFELELISSLYVVTFVTLFYKSFSPSASVYFELISNVFGWGLLWLRSPTIYAIEYGISKAALVSLAALYVYSILNIAFWVLKIKQPSLEYSDIQYNIEYLAMLIFSGFCTWIYISAYVKHTITKK